MNNINTKNQDIQLSFKQKIFIPSSEWQQIFDKIQLDKLIEKIKYGTKFNTTFQNSSFQNTTSFQYNNHTSNKDNPKYLSKNSIVFEGEEKHKNYYNIGFNNSIEYAQTYNYQDPPIVNDSDLTPQQFNLKQHLEKIVNDISAMQNILDKQIKLLNNTPTFSSFTLNKLIDQFLDLECQTDEVISGLEKEYTQKSTSSNENVNENNLNMQNISNIQDVLSETFLQNDPTQIHISIPQSVKCSKNLSDEEEDMAIQYINSVIYHILYTKYNVVQTLVQAFQQFDKHINKISYQTANRDVIFYDFNQYSMKISTILHYTHLILVIPIYQLTQYMAIVFQNPIKIPIYNFQKKLMKQC